MAFGIGRALFTLSRSSKGDVSDMAGRVYIKAVKGRLLGWLVRRRNEMDVERIGAFQLRSMSR